jgi:hypothetical protein
MATSGSGAPALVNSLGLIAIAGWSALEAGRRLLAPGPPSSLG